MKSKVVFGDLKVKKSFDELKYSDIEDKKLRKWLERAFSDLG